MRATRAATFAVAAVFGLGACSLAAEPPARPAASGTRTGGTLTVAIGEPASVDPGNAHDPNGALVAGMLCDTLLHADPATGELKPAIATAWVVTDEGRRLVVRLRDDVRFHDGRRLRADDVVWSLSRLASADYASGAARLLEPVFGFAEVHGDRPTDDERLRERLAGVRVLDESSFEITLSGPRADFVRVLAEPVTAPVSRHAAETDPEAFARRPVCAGPYRLAGEWAPGTKLIRLERFSRYYGRAAAYTNGGRGYADVVEFRIGAAADAGVSRAAAGAAGLTAPTTSVEYVGLPTTTAPFDDPVVRRALALALDRTALLEGPLAGAVPATGFVSPAVPGASGCGGDALPARGDVAAAQRLLADAGISLDGVRLRLYVNDDYGLPPVLLELAGQWRHAFGLVVPVTPLPWHEFLAKGTGASGFDGAFRYSWAPDHASLDAVVYPLAHSASVGRSNLARFADPRIDRILDREARRAETDADRAVAYGRVEQLLCSLVPLVPVAVRTVTWRLSPDVAVATGPALAKTTAAPVLRELWLRP